MPGSRAKDAAEVIETLRRFFMATSATDYLIAYSGGRDSTVLLHAVASLRDELGLSLRAVHVDHGLSPHSGTWSGQCRQQCEALGVDFIGRRVEVVHQGQSLEAAAREARYRVFTELLGESDCLLSAHHREDQAETLLLQLLRGGGVHGLASMPASRPLGGGQLRRPLLGLGREQLAAYAEAQRLEWVEDPSNFDTSLERNWLRHELLPLLRQRREGIDAVLARSAIHFAEAAGLLDELAAGDLTLCAEGAALSIDALAQLSEARQRNLVRLWLRRLALPLPDHRRLNQVLAELCLAAEDAVPLVVWPGAELRRYRGRLYAMAPLPQPLSEPLAWGGGGELELPDGLGWLSLAGAPLDGPLEIRPRRGGEHMHPAGRERSRDLKRLMQEAGVPPWLRERWPLIYREGKLVAVPGLWIDHRYAVQGGGLPLIPRWRTDFHQFAIEKDGENNDN